MTCDDEHIVLLLPPANDPLHLMDTGSYGSSPPTATECTCGVAGHRAVWRRPYSSARAPANACPEPGCSELAIHPIGRVALVLKWDGLLNNIGIFTAWNQADNASYEDDGLADALYSYESLAKIVATWRRDQQPLGELIVLDKPQHHAKDAAPVEPEPVVAQDAPQCEPPSPGYWWGRQRGSRGPFVPVLVRTRRGEPSVLEASDGTHVVLLDWLDSPTTGDAIQCEPPVFDGALVWQNCSRCHDIGCSHPWGTDPQPHPVCNACRWDLR